MSSTPVCERCGQTHDPRRCSGHVDDHETGVLRPCGAFPVHGAAVCIKHGAAAKQVRAKAAARVAEAKADVALRKMLPDTFTAVTDPVGELALLGGEIRAFREVAAAKVRELRTLDYETFAEGEQAKALVVIYERAVDRSERVLVSLAKLGLAERMVRLEEGQAALVAEVLLEVLAVLAPAVPGERARAELARVLRARDALEATGGAA